MSSLIEEYFDNNTMSVHIRENNCAYAKKGYPGDWKFVKISNKILTDEDLKLLAENITENGFVEIERPGSVIIQKDDIRVVIIKPPFSNAWEITAVKPVKLLELSEYKLAEKLISRLKKQAEGVLIAGSPGQGKTTFARALAINYSADNKIVKTIEAPRDMLLPENITQLAIAYGSPEEIQDILLLSRPDYTIFDEMRNTKDFKLFADLRMSGVGMVGVIHATSAVDAIQRFIGRIELGVIPQVIDTVIFIENGEVANIYSLKMTVKVPVGMIEADLARPVVVVNDFYTGKLEFEIYSYGEETVVIPLGHNDMDKILEKQLNNKVEKIKDNTYKVYIPENEFKYAQKKIDRLAKEYGVNIELKKMTNEYSLIKFDIQTEKRYISINPKKDFVGKEVDIYIDNEYLLSAKIGKNNSIKINKESDIGKQFVIAISSKKNIELRV